MSIANYKHRICTLNIEYKLNKNNKEVADKSRLCTSAIMKNTHLLKLTVKCRNNDNLLLSTTF